MTDKVYPKPNLGQGDQWARQIQADLQGAIRGLAKERQRITNLNRSQNATATTTADVYRALEAIQASTTGTGEAAADLANRITALESALGTLRQQQLPSAAKSLEQLYSAPTGVSYAPPITIEVPPGAHFAVISTQLLYAPNVSGTNLFAVAINGEARFSSQLGGTVGEISTTFWAETIALQEGSPTISIGAYIHAGTAGNRTLRQSVHVEFQY